MPDFRIVDSCTQQFETQPVGRQWSQMYTCEPLLAVGERHGLMMHRMIEADMRRSEVHPSDGRCCLEYSRGRQNDSAGNAMIGEVSHMLHTVACFVAHLLGRRTRAVADQRVKTFDTIPGSSSMNRIVFYPVALALE